MPVYRECSRTSLSEEQADRLVDALNKNYVEAGHRYVVEKGAYGQFGIFLKKIPGSLLSGGEAAGRDGPKSDLLPSDLQDKFLPLSLVTFSGGTLLGLTAWRLYVYAKKQAAKESGGKIKIIASAIERPWLSAGVLGGAAAFLIGGGMLCYRSIT